ncbi:MAG: HEAT repeat domain-containing protein, partial [Methanoregula sp.]|nr:HEAT repeat domain-containing protein [Methanoregula sp.]
RSIDPLVTLLHDHDQDVRFATAHALGTIGHPAAAPALKQTCEKDNCFVKIAAEEALLKLGEPDKNTLAGKAGAPHAAFTR